MRTLYGLTQSPWTEKARWALDHHHLPHRYHEHVPLLGEPLLRLKARSRDAGTKPSVPLLVDGDEVFTSSLAIAKYADRIGRADPLFPRGMEEEVERWAAISDRILEAARVSVFRGLNRDAAARREALPGFVPGVLRGVLAPSVRAASWFLGAKYDVTKGSDEERDAAVRAHLDDVRKALDGRPHLTGSFSFADAAIAASLQALRPRAHAPIGPATRRIWTNEALARDYQDLLAWRDATYAKHRIGR